VNIFRGANKGIEKMIGGSFYTNDYEIAESYSELEDEGEVYEFNPIVNLFDVSDFLCDSDFDEGIQTIKEELENFETIYENYDGIYTQNGIQILLFGTLDINDNFEKKTIVELLNDVNAETRRYDR
jgi:hypothetical protein